jgi:hypothetical protein
MMRDCWIDLFVYLSSQILITISMPVVGDEPGGVQDRAERSSPGVRLIVQPRMPEMHGGRVVGEFLFYSIFAKVSDGAQSGSNGGPESAAGFQVTGAGGL